MKKLLILTVAISSACLFSACEEGEEHHDRDHDRHHDRGHVSSTTTTEETTVQAVPSQTTTTRIRSY